MKIAVCVKRVPDTAIKVKIASNGKNIEKADEYVVSPYDEIAVEHAIRLREKIGQAEIVILSLGPADTESIMRKCLAMGADKGILIEDNGNAIDPFVVAKTLAGVLQAEKFDLILFGIKAVDDDNSQVGPMVSALLDIPFLTSVVQWEIAGNKVKAESEVEGGHQIVESPMPCALSIQKSKVDPRIPSLINIKNARKKEIKTIKTQPVSPTLEVQKMEFPPERKGGRIVGKGPDAVPELMRLLKQEAKIL